jgi:hypothetical protein
MFACLFLYLFLCLEQPIIVHDEIPCVPSPCGPNSICRVNGNRAVCSCMTNYIGRPPSCRPECVINSDCAMNLACVNEKCKNPCFGSCGPNTECRVVSHRPMCYCTAGFTGDPFSGCNRIIERKTLRNKMRKISASQTIVTLKDK